MNWKTDSDGRNYKPGDAFTATARRDPVDHQMRLAHDCVDGRVENAAQPSALGTFCCDRCGLVASPVVLPDAMDAFVDTVVSLSAVRMLVERHQFRTDQNDPIAPTNCTCGNKGRVEVDWYLAHLDDVLNQHTLQ